MSALLTRSPAPRRTREGDCRPRPEPESGPTLDDVVSRAWEILRAGLPATCPACGDEFAPRPSAGAGIVGGRCQSCGTTLS
ncbi:MAG: hypothetical protein V7645_2789 [Actinomycetota bacterium]|jgi:hypothetical protein